MNFVITTALRVFGAMIVECKKRKWEIIRELGLGLLVTVERDRDREREANRLD